LALSATDPEWAHSVSTVTEYTRGMRISEKFKAANSTHDTSKGLLTLGCTTKHRVTILSRRWKSLCEIVTSPLDLILSNLVGHASSKDREISSIDDTQGTPTNSSRDDLAHSSRTDIVWSLATWSLFSFSLYLMVDFQIRVTLLVSIIFFLHEMGHWLIARLMHARPSLPRFIPFLGGFVLFDTAKDDRWRVIATAASGPLVGCVASDALVLIGSVFHHPSFFEAGLIGIALQAVNLLPVPPLDGWRVLKAFSPWPMWLTFAGMAAAIISSPKNLDLWYFALQLMGIAGIYQLLVLHSEPEEPVTRRVAEWGVVVMYLGTLAFQALFFVAMAKTSEFFS